MSDPQLVVTSFTLKGTRLTFSVPDAAVALRCWSAREKGLEVTVTLAGPEGLREITGKVQNVEILPLRVRPTSWQVVMEVSE